MRYTVEAQPSAEIVMVSPASSGSAIAFIGFVQMGDVKTALDRTTIKMLNNAVKENLKQFGVDLNVPDLPDLMDKVGVNIRDCSEAACTADIAGAMGLERGMYATIEASGADRAVVWLHLVNQRDGTITHEVYREATLSSLRQTAAIQQLGRELATEMVKKMSGG